MTQLTFIAGRDMQIGGQVRPRGAEVPEAARWKNLAAYIRQGQIILRGPGAEDALAQYRRAPPVGRTPSEALIRQAQIQAGMRERPLLEVDDETAEQLEREGRTVDDLVDEITDEALTEAQRTEREHRRRRRR